MRNAGGAIKYVLSCFSQVIFAPNFDFSRWKVESTALTLQDAIERKSEISLSYATDPA
jgi:hypothetical protein